MLVDQKRVFVRAVDASAILHNPQPPSGDLVDHTMVEEDDAVRNVLFCDYRRHAFILKPSEQATQFRAQYCGIAEPAEECLDGIQNNALGTDRVDRVAQPDKKALQVVVSGLLDLVALNAYEVDHELLLSNEFLDIETQRTDVLCQFFGCFFKGHEDAGLLEVENAA